MTKTLASAKKFVVDHKVGVAIVVTAATCATMSYIGNRQVVAFLKENDLWETYINR